MPLFLATDPMTKNTDCLYSVHKVLNLRVVVSNQEETAGWSAADTGHLQLVAKWFPCRKQDGWMF